MKKYFIFILSLTLVPLKTFWESFDQQLVEFAINRTNHYIVYDGSYVSIDYPNGNVPAHTGVCTDVIIRSYRKLGLDLQELVHEDMNESFDKYPSKRIWGLSKTDKNIDHRRVPNLQAFLQEMGFHYQSVIIRMIINPVAL